MKRFISNRDGAVYHCMNRTIHGMHLLDDKGKSVFRKMLWQVADFCGVEVITYCLMNNHFHILVRVPKVDSISGEELVRRYGVLYPRPTARQPLTPERLAEVLAENGPAATALRESLLRRMHDLSTFLKILKQRFSIWYNAENERYGTFWAERFRSILVEPSRYSMLIVAAYIDLNPIRAGLVKSPEEYLFCGYTDARNGHEVAIRGICHVVFDAGDSDADKVAAYYKIICLKGMAPKRSGKGRSMEPHALKSEASTKQPIHEQKSVPNGSEGVSLIDGKERLVSESVAIGSAQFVHVIGALRQQLLGLSRRPKTTSLTTKICAIPSLRRRTTVGER